MEDTALSPPDHSQPAVYHSDWSDLSVRIASGLALAVGGLGAAWLGGPWLAAACAAASVIMSYEWARMSEPGAVNAAFGFALIGSLGAVLSASWGRLDVAFAWLLTLSVLSALLRRRTWVGAIETAGGATYVGLAPCVLLWLRYQDHGLAIVLALFAIIWAADIFAYFGGKLLGGPKVAEGLSPNKTWSGIVCGSLAGAAAGWSCGVVLHAVGSATLTWFAVGVALAFTGLMGDLFESFLKRRFGVKDASRIIPGHGGVLDRIDGLMAATLLAAAVILARPEFVDSLFGARSWR